MKKTSPYLFKNVITDTERLALLDYMSVDDNRTDSRPDVRSKHPRWNDESWPRNIIESAMNNCVGKGFIIEEITFRQDKIGLGIHTDHGNPADSTGKTIMFLLDAQPIAHTIFFKNYWAVYEKFGAFFTKSKWSPYSYSLENNIREKVRINDLRDFLHQCETSPDSIVNFNINTSFLNMIKELIHKRSFPKLELNKQNKTTGYMQPGLRVSNYDTLTNYNPQKKFDINIHKEFMEDIPIDDLNGLEVDSIFEWENNAALIFDREQLHCSGSTHQLKSFITIFYHHPGQ